MTRKDYKLIAEVLVETKNDDLYLILAFCDKLQEDNPNFDPEKFIAYINKLGEGRTICSTTQ